MKKIIISLLFILFSTIAFSEENHYPLGSTEWYFTDSHKVIYTFYDKNDKGLVRLVQNLSNKEYHIEVDSLFEKWDISFMVEEFLTEVQGINKYATRVYLSSYGGWIRDGMELGRVLRKYGAESVVFGDQICASACSVAFIGGEYRSITYNAKVGVHTPYIPGKYGVDKCLTKEESLPLIKYIKEMLPQSIANKFIFNTFSNCSNNMIWIYKDGYITTQRH